MSNIVPASIMQITCPDELRGLKAWVTWRYEQTPEEKAKGKKPRKVPYYANGRRRYGVQGTAEDRGNLVTFDQAKLAAIRAGHDGIGFVPQPEIGITIIDFDNAIMSDGELHPDVTLAAGMTYCEVSPSGHGIHAFFRGSFPNKKSHANADRFGVEVFCSSGFVTFTGRPTDECTMLSCENTIAPLSELMLQILSERFLQDGTLQRAAQSSEAIGYTDEQLQALLAAIDPGDDAYHAWINVGMALHHETDGDGRGFELWDEWSQRGAKYEGREVLQGKWEGFGHNPAAPVTVRSLVAQARDAGVSIGGPVATADDFDDLGPDEEAGREKAETRKLQTYSFLDLLLDESPEEPDYIAPDFLGPGNFCLIAGPPKAQKSFLVGEMLLACALGTTFLAGLFNVPRPLRVYYLQAEMNAKLLRRRVKMLGGLVTDGQHAALGANLKISGRFHMILDKGGVEAVVAEIRRAYPNEPPDIIAIDPLANVFDGESEDKAAEVMQFLRGRVEALRRAINPAAAIVMVHHSAKRPAEEMARDPFIAIRGSGALRGYYDTGVVIHKVNEDTEHRRIAFELRNGRGPDSMTVALDAFGSFQRVDQEAAGMAPDTVEQILEHLDQAWNACRPLSLSPQTRNDGRYAPLVLSRQLGLRADAVKGIIENLMADGFCAVQCYNLRDKSKGLKVLKKVKKVEV